MSDMMMPGGMPPMPGGPQGAPAAPVDEAQELIARWQEIPADQKRQFVAAMTPEVAGVLIQLLPPVYDELILAVTEASPDMIQDAPGAMPPPGGMPPGGPGGMQPGPMPGAPMPGAPMGQPEPAGANFADALGSPYR